MGLFLCFFFSHPLKKSGRNNNEPNFFSYIATLHVQEGLWAIMANHETVVYHGCDSLMGVASCKIINLAASEMACGIVNLTVPKMACGIIKTLGHLELPARPIKVWTKSMGLEPLGHGSKKKLIKDTQKYLWGFNSVNSWVGSNFRRVRRQLVAWYVWYCV